MLTASKNVGYKLCIVRQTACLFLSQSRLMSMLHFLVDGDNSCLSLNNGFDLKLRGSPGGVL